jgi:hypothetical protein
MGLDGQLKAGLDDGSTDGVVATACTQGREGSLVILTRVAQGIPRTFRMAKNGTQVSHDR